LIAVYGKYAQVFNSETAEALSEPLSPSSHPVMASFMPGGQTIISANYENSATLVDWHTGWVYYADFSPDEQLLATASYDGEVRIWDLESGRENEPPLEAFELFQFDQSLKHLAVVTGTKVQLVDLGPGTIKQLTHPYPITCLQFSRDGLMLVCASMAEDLEAKLAQLWNTMTGLPIGGPLQHTDGVLDAEFSPDGKLVVTASEDRTAVIWNVSATRRTPLKLQHHGKVYHAEFAHHQPWVVTASEDHTAVIWDSKTGDPLTPPFEHSQSLHLARFTDDDTAILTTDADGRIFKWPLPIDRRPVREIVRNAEALAGLPSSDLRESQP
jgi:WD40 repeat protein